MRALLAKNTVETILRPGQIVAGQYRVDHLVGQGGMAAVWAGTNEHTGKRVALKVILLSLSTTREAQDLFRSEALAASRVNHPNVVTVFDVIEHEGMACIVMEMLDGESLTSYIARKGSLSVDEATTLLLPAMRGVAAANAQGVIHRDLKPQNIFICVGPDGRIVTTKVLDFGISVIVERVMDPSARPVPGLVMGTPAYMSPEHILGAARVDERADVYGFGVLLYEALTGQTPFPGEPGPDLFDCVLHKPATPVTLLRPDLPPGLVRIIETAMAKERDQRYSDLNLMVSALEDELMPPTPAPRLLTPLAGVPAFAAHDPLAEPLARAAEAIRKKEPSGQHGETQILFALPGQVASKESGADGSSNGGSTDGSKEYAPTSRETVLVNRRSLFRKPPLLGPGPPSTFRGWRGLMGAGLAVALGFFAVWTALRNVSEAQTSAPAPVASPTPTASEPIAYPPVSAVASTAIPAVLAVPAPLAASLSPLAPKRVATRAHSNPASHARATPAPVTPSRAGVAMRETWKNLPTRLEALRETSERNEPVRALSKSPSAGASARSATPRAGRLSKDDF
jgi:serine/threonine protein kinase